MRIAAVDLLPEAIAKQIATYDVKAVSQKKINNFASSIRQRGIRTASFNIEWEHVFQAKSRDEPLSAKFPLVCRGKHGLILAHAWASHYAGLESTTATDLDMIRLRVEALLRLIPAALEAHAEAAKKKPANSDSDSDEDELPAAIAPSAKPPKTSSDVKGKNKAVEGKRKNKPVAVAAPKDKAPAKQAKARQHEPGPPDEDAPISIRSSDDETSKAKSNPKVRLGEEKWWSEKRWKTAGCDTCTLLKRAFTDARYIPKWQVPPLIQSRHMDGNVPCLI
ncbi:hypothetical protein B0H13DRAFT_1882099 [Mycena leptocephala]|nr:hypothetical protein B0H13DRAFT_1882099 [Mycena leptocephala]